MTLNPTIMFETAEMGDLSELIDNITLSFIKYDPLTNYLQMTKQEFNIYLEPKIIYSLQNKLTLIARDTHNNFIGTSVNYDFVTQFNYAHNLLTPKINSRIEFFKNAALEHYLITKELSIHAGLILSGSFLMVDSKYYGLNIPELLGERVMSLAKENKFRFITSNFTNPCNYYLHKRKLGPAMEIVKRIKYNDFVTSSGARPLLHANGDCIMTITDLDKMLEQG